MILPYRICWQAICGPAKMIVVGVNVLVWEFFRFRARELSRWITMSADRLEVTRITAVVMNLKHLPLNESWGRANFLTTDLNRSLRKSRFTNTSPNGQMSVPTSAHGQSPVTWQSEEGNSKSIQHFKCCDACVLFHASGSCDIYFSQLQNGSALLSNATFQPRYLSKYHSRRWTWAEYQRVLSVPRRIMRGLSTTRQ